MNATPESRQTHASAFPRNPSFFWLLGILTAVFGGLRFACLLNDLWLDEIWSIRSVEKISSATQILTELRHDNNHPLNSLFIYLLLPAKADWTYRLLSWLAGTIAVVLAGLIGREQFQRLHPTEESRHADAAGLITALLFGGSYLFIHYSSEARGYGPAVMFGLLAIHAMLRAPARPSNRWTAIYGVACVLGVLAHLVAFHVMLAGLVWSLMKAMYAWKSWRDRLIHLVSWQLGPWLFFVAYYFGFVRRLEIGGGPDSTLASVLADLSAYSFGVPQGFPHAATLFVLIAVVVIGVALIARTDRSIALFYATAILVAPALGLVSSRFTLLFPRYFIATAECALLLAGYSLARLWNSSRTHRIACCALLAAFLAGNALHTARLLRDGRGQYRNALRYLAEQTPTSAIAVSSDNDGRNFTMIDYYRAAIGPGRSLNYFPVDQIPMEQLQWILVHRLDDGEIPPEVLAVRGKNFRRDRVFPHAALSGWDWYVYRPIEAAKAASFSR